MMQCADQVFSGRGIDRGLPADGTVNLRKQGGRRLYIRNATLIYRRDKSRKIADNTTTKRDKK